MVAEQSAAVRVIVYVRRACTQRVREHVGRVVRRYSLLGQLSEGLLPMPTLEEARRERLHVHPTTIAGLVILGVCADLALLRRSCPTGRLFHLAREREVESADAAGIVRGQVDYDPIKDVGPLGMVVLPLREERARRHEPEGFGEACELVLAVELALFNRPVR